MTSKKTPAAAMDDTVKERASGAAHENNPRVCWAIQTLVSEMQDLFPETNVEYSGYNMRNAALDVAFDLSMLVPEDADTAVELLGLIEGDARVAGIVGEDGAVLVSMKPDARTQDSRETFNLLNLFEILTEGDDGPYYDSPFILDGGSL